MFTGGFVWLVLVRDYTMRIREPAKIAILRTYGAGSPLTEAHFRRQPLEVSNVPLHGHAKAIAESIKSATLDVTPLLCVSTWQHSYMTDYRIDGKDKFLEAWWEAINWDLVNIKAIDVYNMQEHDKSLAAEASARLSGSTARSLSDRYKSGSY
jgi:Fe-Mn family superoxide dismutase